MSGPQARGSAQDAVYEWLKRHVTSLPRHEGVFLTEGQVAIETGASRTPVREALLRMEAQGFLKIVPKKGAYVPPISDSEVEAVMEARALVEDWCVRRLPNITADLTTALERLIGEQEGLVADPVGFIECDRRFHRTMVEAAGNPVLLDFYESLRDRQVRMGLRAVTSTVDRTSQVLREHRAIVEGLQALQPDKAALALGQHLANTLSILRPRSLHPSWLPTGEAKESSK